MRSECWVSVHDDLSLARVLYNAYGNGALDCPVCWRVSRRVRVCISFEACRLEQLDQGRECTHNHLACIYCCEAEDQ